MGHCSRNPGSEAWTVPRTAPTDISGVCNLRTAWRTRCGIPSPRIPSSPRPASAGLFFGCGCQPVVGYRNPMPDRNEDFGARPRGALRRPKLKRPELPGRADPTVGANTGLCTTQRTRGLMPERVRPERIRSLTSPLAESVCPDLRRQTRAPSVFLFRGCELF